KIGEELADADAITVHRLIDSKPGFDHPAGRSQSQFVDHLNEDRLQRRSCIAFKSDAAPQPTAREVEDVVDHRGHAHYRGLHHGDDLALLLALDSSVGNSRAGANGSEGI